ncbi:FmdE family protein [Anaerocolumna sp. MB42-C2]|uniref:FmdE family protein n=1 Tax=Anaerocolumna sp. MB42-C2 TaxID=3070997 RepID=UPI002ED1612C
MTENDACGVDAIQVILGCSAGKGNLIFRIRGKQAYSFYNRKTGKSVRVVLKSMPDMVREERERYLMNHETSELFDVKDTTYTLPERARIFKSVKCEKCGEMTAESMIRLEDGKKLCLDCYSPYSRSI